MIVSDWGGGIHDYVNNDTYTAMMKTQNKGILWDTCYLSKNTFYSFSDIYFIDNLSGWAVGQKSSINAYLLLQTEDGGATWQEKILPELIYFNGTPVGEASIIHSIQFVNDTLGWLTCEGKYHSGYILLTNDRGETWQQQYVNENIKKPIYDICMVDNNNGWAVGADYIYHTTNGDTIIINGIDENIKEKDLFTIAPNPTNGVFTIKTNHQLLALNGSRRVNYQLYDITGRIVYKASIKGMNIIDISCQPKGIYFLTILFQINSQTSSLTKKIIKL